MVTLDCWGTMSQDWGGARAGRHCSSLPHRLKAPGDAGLPGADEAGLGELPGLAGGAAVLCAACFALQMHLRHRMMTACSGNEWHLVKRHCQGTMSQGRCQGWQGVQQSGLGAGDSSWFLGYQD